MFLYIVVTAFAIMFPAIVFSKPVAAPTFPENIDPVERDKMLDIYANRLMSRFLSFLGLFLVIAIAGNSAVYYINSTVETDYNSKKESTLKDLNRFSFLRNIEENGTIVKATITNQDFLAIAVVNDGQDKTSLATYYCGLAKSKKIGITFVKIIDAANADLSKEYASGTVLAKSYCH